MHNTSVCVTLILGKSFIPQVKLNLNLKVLDFIKNYHALGAEGLRALNIVCLKEMAAEANQGFMNRNFKSLGKQKIVLGNIFSFATPLLSLLSLLSFLTLLNKFLWE